MSKYDFGNRIKLTSYDEMFGINGGQEKPQAPAAPEQPAAGNGITVVNIRDLHTFKGHPFSVIEDSQMDELIESVKKVGILSPVLVRNRTEGGYELISGHRRRHAAIKAGLKEMPVIIRELDDDEAAILVVDANIQREHIFPSEKAKAYAMKYEALKHQGKRNSESGKSLYLMEENSGDSHTQIQRYIKLASLREELLILLDDEKLQIRPGVYLADLGTKEQGWVNDVIRKEHAGITEAQALEIRNLYKEGLLTQGGLYDILCGDKEMRRKVSFGAKKLDHYFTPNTSNKQIEALIIRLLEEWKAAGGTL